MLETDQNQDLSVIIPAKASGDFIVRQVGFLLHYLQQHWQGQFEIVVALNGDAGDIADSAAQLQQSYPDDSSLVLHKHYAPAGKGAALQSAFLKTQYPLIAFIDADLPFDLEFLLQAQQHIDKGASLVAGNRRLPQSIMQLPTQLLPTVFKRHVFGVMYNQAVRWLFGIQQSDTQCGIKLMTRDFAEQLFRVLTCHGFSFDVEMFLLAKARGYKVVSQAVTLMQSHEKSTLKLGAELLRSVYWFAKFKAKQIKGEYQQQPLLTSEQMALLHFTSDDWGLSKAVNDGILVLAQQGVVKRVSIMSTALELDYRLQELLQVPNIQLGLHFNLTNGPMLGEYQLGSEMASGFSLNALLVRCWFGLKNLSKPLINDISNEFELQAQSLIDKGIPISYFDGHHHMHLLPGVLAKIAPIAINKGIGHTRLVLDHSLFGSIKYLLVFLSYRAKPVVKQAGLNYLPLSYPSMKAFLNRSRWRRQLCKIELPTEVICHPATLGDLQCLPQAYTDTYDGARAHEFWAIRSLY
jgi:dolichyl-phosphate beta-glucosyltransferase